MIFAGTPTTVQLLGISFMTTAFAPITTLFPILIGPKIFAPVPIYTLSPITGTSNKPDLPPTVTFDPIMQFLPIIVLLCNTTPIPL